MLATTDGTDMVQLMSQQILWISVFSHIGSNFLVVSVGVWEPPPPPPPFPVPISLFFLRHIPFSFDANNYLSMTGTKKILFVTFFRIRVNYRSSSFSTSTPLQSMTYAHCEISLTHVLLQISGWKDNPSTKTRPWKELSEYSQDFRQNGSSPICVSNRIWKNIIFFFFLFRVWSFEFASGKACLGTHFRPEDAEIISGILWNALNNGTESKQAMTILINEIDNVTEMLI